MPVLRLSFWYGWLYEIDYRLMKILQRKAFILPETLCVFSPEEMETGSHLFLQYKVIHKTQFED